MLKRQDLEEREDRDLAPYAMRSAHSRGRDYAIEPDTLRTEFQRDRDRIIHSAAFRKLEYKTQVYMVHYGDYFRTRLTHSMEVAQVARTLARNLRLNTDLTEAVALAHDVGHTPFGHSGEEAMKKMLKDFGGFEHNEQGLRVVEYLEERYPDIRGLNLTYEVREGIIKHDTEYDSPTIEARFRPDEAPLLESQVCDLADEIAYNNHDLDDALKMGLIEEDDLREVDWVWEIYEESRSALAAGTPKKFAKYRMIGTLIDMQVADALETTEANIASRGIKTLEDVRKATTGRIVSFSKGLAARNRVLKDFLMRRVYRHPRVVRSNHKAEDMVSRMFQLYMSSPDQLPLKYQARIAQDGLHRVVTDYLGGMTDRYLIEDYIRAFEPTHYVL